jgi:hypothetical protein
MKHWYFITFIKRFYISTLLHGLLLSLFYSDPVVVREICLIATKENLCFLVITIEIGKII